MSNIVDYCSNGGGQCVNAINGEPACTGNNNFTIGRCCNGASGQQRFCCSGKVSIGFWNIAMEYSAWVVPIESFINH